MEMNEDGFLEELLALRREAWDSAPSSSTADHQINGFFSTANWPFDGLDSTTPSYESLSSTIDQQPLPPTTTLDCASIFLHTRPSNPTFPGPSPGPDPDYTMSSMLEEVNNNGSSNNNNIDNSSIFPSKTEHSSMSSSEVEFEIPLPSPAAAGFSTGLCLEKSRSTGGNAKSKVKKVEGQPSKNLMAERRRRKRLNDRLSMLRSVVPKISKMDRTSILGDTIDYMKELLERINNLQEEMDVGADQLNVKRIFEDVKPNDVFVRNSPKFDVERRNLDTRVEICCAGKPGLLLSTLTTLEALGLKIQQCVISCFNDFSLQASCFEEMEQKDLINSEEMKQALFRNAGYGGMCL